MKYLTTNEIRQIWNDFWQDKGHFLVESKSLIPYNDDSLLFINSGVSTLKNYLSGLEIPPSKRLVSSQKSLRTNDIENVGVTSRHHTMFEMLGNFSIGDYFKEEAIHYGFDLLTNEKYYDLDVEKLYITVYPNDEDSIRYWINAGIDKNHIIRLEDNFWEIGKGPGGPNTEIFFDRGEKYDSRNAIELLEKDIENDRVIEIWNIVFSQYNCDPEIPREKYKELPQKNIDTGMGLERMASVLQDADTNYETDNFQIIIKEIEKITNTKYSDFKKEYRIITDHIRALVFAISDGVVPSNEGRGYVIRRILRRALKNAYQKLDIKEEPFLYKLVDSVILQMEDYYPELKKNKKIIKEIIKKEEESFLLTLKSGIKYFNEMIEDITDCKINGEIAFKLYDTYGFPFDLTKELAKDINYQVDEQGFLRNLEMQKERARSSRKDITTISEQNEFITKLDIKSEFIGYDTLEADSKILLLTDLNQELDVLRAGEIGYIILDKTPFYATSGGQKSDIGASEDIEVLEVTKTPSGSPLHKVYALKDLKKNDVITAKVDEDYRASVSKNHSATHLLHLALRKVIGDVAHQAGSDQNNLRTRFDYTTHKAPTKEELRKIENMVNELIVKKEDVIIFETTQDEAKKLGAQALFGEKYGDIVRVVKIGESLELCGGTHIKNTKDIEKFYIVKEESVGSGIRRIEALTADQVSLHLNSKQKEFEIEQEKLEETLQDNKLIKSTQIEAILEELKNLKNVLEFNLDVYEKVVQNLKTENSTLEKTLKSTSQNIITEKVDEILHDIDLNSKNIFIEEFVENINNGELKDLADALLNKIKSGVVVLKLINNEKITIVVKVSEDKAKEYNAGIIVKEKLKPYDGKGGGKPTFGQGGGTYHK